MALAAGMNAHIAKPFELRLLKNNTSMAEIRRLKEAPFCRGFFLCYNADIYFRKERRETMDYFVLTVASLILFAATFSVL